MIRTCIRTRTTIQRSDLKLSSYHKIDQLLLFVVKNVMWLLRRDDDDADSKFLQRVELGRHNERVHMTNLRTIGHGIPFAHRDSIVTFSTFPAILQKSTVRIRNT